MDVDDFDEFHRVWSVDPGSETSTHPEHMHRDNPQPRRPRATMPENRAARPGIEWVRASDLLSTGTGRIAGRGIDFESELARRMRRAPGATRRALRTRADRLPPLSEFGQPHEHPQMTRHGLGRS